MPGLKCCSNKNLREDHPFVKFVIVGDSGVGKSVMLHRACGNPYKENPITIFDVYSPSKSVDGVNVSVSPWDTNGRDDYDRLRPLSYPQADVFSICFDVSNPLSFERVKEKWLPELQHHCPNVPIVLVGCKIDLRSNEEVISMLKEKGQDLITKAQGRAMAENIRAAKYMECSALTGEGTAEFIDDLCRLVLQQRGIINIVKAEEKKCTLV